MMMALEKTRVGVIRKQRPTQASMPVVWWIALIGIFFPPVLFSIGSLNFTPGRLVLILLLGPCVVSVLKNGRRFVGSDGFAVALVIWILTSSTLSGGFKPYVAAEALEFISAYLLGRAFILGPANFEMFIRALKVIIFVVVAFSLLDTFSGRHVTMDSFGLTPEQSLLNGKNEYRFGLVRAASLFIGPEQNGTFCVMAACIFLYAERGLKRGLYVGVSVFGCLLALSSGPIMALALISSLFVYDKCMQSYPWRWRLVVGMTIVFVLAVTIVSDHPVEWILVHMTLDPQTGFFRLGMWNYAIPLLGQSPLIGYGLVQLGASDEARLYLWSIDCIWLVEALRYGLPAAILLFLTIFWSSFGKNKQISFNRSGGDVSTGLTLAFVAFSFIGLTVHFWDGSWLFLNLCVGVRASLVEWKGSEAVSVSSGRGNQTTRRPNATTRADFSRRLGASARRERFG